VPRPTLVVVSGPTGTGKTTLAHELARAIPCPAICRDEIKEGMVHTAGEFTPGWGDELTQRTFPLFFSLLRLLLENGVTVVAEAAFQQKLWGPNLEPLMELADIRIIQCRTDAETARRRVGERGTRAAHADAQWMDGFSPEAFEAFDRVSIGVPSIDVDTTSGYEPPLEEIVAFVRAGR
jgi:predicted kinase